MIQTDARGDWQKVRDCDQMPHAMLIGNAHAAWWPPGIGRFELGLTTGGCVTVNYDFANDDTPPVDKLKKMLADKANARETDFDWIKDIVEKTLDEYVKETIEVGFDSTRYNPFAIDENLAECSRLIDVCLVQRTEIYQLEAQGILSALDLSYSRELVSKEQTISGVMTEAAIEQAGLDEPTDVRLAQNEKYRLKKLEIAERIALHGRVGSSLHYGERVAFLRKVYVENLQRINECLWALWAGLKGTYNITVPLEHDYREVLKANPAASILNSNVAWVRQAIDLLDVRKKSMIERDIWVFPEIDLSTYRSTYFDLKSYFKESDVAIVKGVKVFWCFSANALPELEKSIKDHTNHSLGNDYLSYMQNIILQRRQAFRANVKIRGPGMWVRYGTRALLFRAETQAVARGWTETTDIDADPWTAEGGIMNCPALYLEIKNYGLPVQWQFEVAETYASPRGQRKVAELYSGDATSNEIFAQLTRVRRLAVQLRVAVLAEVDWITDDAVEA